MLTGGTYKLKVLLRSTPEPPSRVQGREPGWHLRSWAPGVIFPLNGGASLILHVELAGNWSAVKVHYHNMDMLTFAYLQK